MKLRSLLPLFVLLLSTPFGQNRDWLFVVEAASDALFDEAIDKHPYISKK